jgi:AAA family ATP:ADP antiporter
MIRFFNPFDIRRGEGRKTLLMFFYFFFTILVLYVLKPVRSSLFLEELGSENLRYVYLGEGLFLLFVTWAYVELAKRLPKKKLFTGVLLSFVVSLALFWWLFLLKTPFLSAFFYVWVACFSITSVTQFWTLANDIYDPLEAKRLFGLIISGGSAGGVLGGIFTSQAVRWLRTEDLLLVSAAILSLCIVLIAFIWQHVPGASATGSHREEEAAGEAPSVRKLFSSSSYLWMIAGVVLLAKVASTVVDNQFNAAVEAHLVGKEAKTAFFGGFSAALNVISFLMQLYATSASLRLLGLGISLTLLPVGLGIASLATFFYPLLSTATWLKVFDGSMNYSIQQASKEVLYLPLSSAVRYRVKPIIDMLVYRASKSLGGLLIIFLAPLFAIPNERVGILVVALVPLWLPLVWKTRTTYLALLQENLLKRRQEREAPLKGRRPEEVLNFLGDETSFGKLRFFLEDESTVGRKMAAAAHLVYHRAGKGLEGTRRLVNEMIRWEALESTPGEKGPEETLREREFLDQLLLQQAEREIRPGKHPETLRDNPETLLKRLGALLEDPRQEMVLKRKAVRLLEHQATQEASDRTLEMVIRTEVHALRLLLAQALLRMKERNPSIRWNRNLIKRATLQEAELFQKLEQLRHFYLKKNQGRGEEFLEATLRALAEETLERIFRLLELLFPSESLALIREQLVGHPEADPVRSHAVELFHNLLGAEFSGLFERLFDEKTVRETSEETIVSLLEEMLRSRDRWLWLAARFLIVELGLEARWSELGLVLSESRFEFPDV